MGVGLLIDKSRKFGIVRPDADLSRVAFTKVVNRAISRAKRLALNGLVVVMPEVRGFPPPSATPRKDMVTEWAQSARDAMFADWASMAAGRIRLVIVAPEDYIDRERIGVAIAATQGLSGNVFATESEGIDWLTSTMQQPLSGRNFSSARPHHHVHHHRHH